MLCALGSPPRLIFSVHGKELEGGGLRKQRSVAEGNGTIGLFKKHTLESCLHQAWRQKVYSDVPGALSSLQASASSPGIKGVGGVG